MVALIVYASERHIKKISAMLKEMLIFWKDLMDFFFFLN